MEHEATTTAACTVWRTLDREHRVIVNGAWSLLMVTVGLWLAVVGHPGVGFLLIMGAGYPMSEGVLALQDRVETSATGIRLVRGRFDHTFSWAKVTDLRPYRRRPTDPARLMVTTDEGRRVLLPLGGEHPILAQWLRRA